MVVEAWTERLRASTEAGLAVGRGRRMGVESVGDAIVETAKQAARVSLSKDLTSELIERANRAQENQPGNDHDQMKAALIIALVGLGFEVVE